MRWPDIVLVIRVYARNINGHNVIQSKAVTVPVIETEIYCAAAYPAYGSKLYL
jgi:hypothetical protein